jgi:hypothetical protein
MLPMGAPATLPGFGGSGTDCMRFRKKMSERFPPGRDTRGPRHVLVKQALPIEIPLMTQILFADE